MQKSTSEKTIRWAAKIIAFLAALPIVLFLAYIGVELFEEFLRWMAIRLS